MGLRVGQEVVGLRDGLGEVGFCVGLVGLADVGLADVGLADVGLADVGLADVALAVSFRFYKGDFEEGLR